MYFERTRSTSFLSTVTMLTWLCIASIASADNASTTDDGTNAAGIEFFESRIRPVLVERCYECHNTAETAEADLAVDWRDGIRAETEHGRVVVPGKPQASLLLKVIRHEITDLEMPEGGPKLDASVAADFAKWIEMGAPDPRTEPPSTEELSKATSWENKLAKRKQWWSFQPVSSDIVAPSEYEVTQLAGKHPIDRFIVAKLRETGLKPAKKADRRTLIRRLSFALTGLPPAQADIEQFINDNSARAFEKLVDQYLDSSHFGERWARHWMDLLRYSDSHGSEGDPQIPHAYQYRDYLIRAINADVPYDQLVREHLAGDLLEDPRINEELGINESAIGPAHFRFVSHGFAPTDALDEKVRFTDDQINVVSKAFQGLTVSCARCHNHKFDAISQADYYAMFGIFASCRPALRDVNLPDRKIRNAQEIRKQKRKLKKALAKAWLEATDGLADRLLDPNDSLKEKLESAKDERQLLNFWKRLAIEPPEDKTLADAWDELHKKWSEQRDVKDQPDNLKHWNLTENADYKRWFTYGNGLPEAPTGAGTFTIGAEGNVVSGIFPAGVVSHDVSERHRSFLASPRFDLDKEYDAWFLVAGGGQPSLRYVVENYPRNGTVYPIKTVNSPNFRWEKMNLKYWTGDHIHFELATSKDAPLQNRNKDKSWFAIRDVVMRESGAKSPPDVSLEYLTPLFEENQDPPATKGELASRIQSAVKLAIQGWSDGSTNDAQAILLNAALPILPNSTEELTDAKKTIERVRKLEAEIPDPTRVPGVVEADAFDQALFDRGDHRKPGQLVKRRFLEAIDNKPYQPKNSGRLELAASILDADNPLTARVFSNRVWHYLFGKGIVSTPDNFGQLGSQPSHPELLDYLANRLRENEWSIKDAVRFVVTSKTWQADSQPSETAAELDPENALLSHANVNRLDAESIRDSLLAVSGELDNTMFGSGFGANSEGRRRSVYITSRRNSLDEFLKAFDSPTPFATTGRRDTTNVPSQSLMLLNDPMVLRLAQGWANTVIDATDDPKNRVQQMVETAFGRESTEEELNTLLGYVESTDRQFAERQESREQLDKIVAETRQAIAAIEQPARKRLTKKDAKKEDGEANANLKPIAAWEFEGDMHDAIGELHGKAHNGATTKDGALVLDGEGYVATGSLPKDLKAKTLEAWVQLDTLDQSGGGVIAVQTKNGVVFDSIVFAERRPRRWMAGSNGFVRTEDFNGADEGAATKAAVHIAITYDDAGEIRCYRNGQRYGRSTKKGGLQTFSGESSQILFGLRHGTVGADDGGRKLRGKVFAARLYDRALSDEEIMAAASGGSFVSDEKLLESLTGQQREDLLSLREKLAKHEQKLATLPKPPEANEAWARLAHALFNLKEFIYLK